MSAKSEKRQRRKRKCLSFEDQAEVIRKLKAGVDRQIIQRDYGISRSCCYKIWSSSREELVTSKINSNITKNRKSNKTCKDKILEEAVITWFQQARDRGDPISGTILQEKALFFNEKLHLSPTFKASSGWLNNFKNRYGIKSYTIKGEKFTGDPDGAKNFSEFLNDKIRQENLNLENIYNADECGIFWNTLASHILSHNKDDVLVHENNKERVTALFCANASGNYRIPLLIIGESATPSCINEEITPTMEQKRLKFLQSHKIIYTHQSSAYMDAEIFKLWYTEVFIPTVIEFQKQSGTSGKVILILDNAPSHPKTEELNALNTKFEIVYLRSNVSAMIQPMNQGAISLTKKYYKHNLLKEALFNREETIEFLKKINLNDCFIHLNNAWNSLQNSTLNKIWKPLLGESCVIQENTLLVDDPNTGKEETCDTLDGSPVYPTEICNQLCQKLQQLEQPVKQLKECLYQWLDSDDSDCGWEPLTDDVIVQLVTQRQVEASSLVRNECDSDQEDSQFPKLSSAEAFSVVKHEYDSDQEDSRFHKLSSSEAFSVVKHEYDSDKEDSQFHQLSTSEAFIAVKNEYDSDKEDSQFHQLSSSETISAVENQCDSDQEDSQFHQISASEALEGLQKFKKWMSQKAEFSAHHRDCLVAMENLTKQEMKKFSIESVYFNL